MSANQAYPSKTHIIERRAASASVKKLSPFGGRKPRLPALRRGFTLLEVMIAVTVTLLMMLGLAQMFKVLGDSMNRGRAGLELNNRLRSVMHRVRTDLENVTAPARPPLPVGAAQGYLKYYEGPVSDYTFADNPRLNRFGDMDDIFMATVKAKDTWFTGKVPRFVAERRALDSTQPLVDGNNNNIPDELEDLVTIASQYAEVIIFAQPFYSNPNNQSGMPDRFRLHYRALLIRPDLNLDNTGALPSHPSANVMVARPQTDLVGNPIGSPQGDMFRVFQYCDLSVRRFNHFVGISNVVANSLEDLANPANRFAHVMHRLSGDNSVWTMPVLALQEINSAFLGLPGIFQDYPGISGTILPTTVGTGFLNPAFVLQGDRTGEDLLATDLLAFDIKAYDPSAPIIEFTPPNPSESFALRPGDPGFETFGLPGLVTNPTEWRVAAYGEFVDIGWAAKIPNSVNLQIMQSELSGLRINSTNSPPTRSFTNELFKSGSAKFRPNGVCQIFQPSFDTFTDSYERDSVFQAELQSYGRGLVTALLGPDPTTNPTFFWNRTSIDAGTDGIDNPGTNVGIDDVSELETSPPFPVHIRGLQISIRLEDRGSKQFKQMSTVKQFVTN